MNEEWRDVVGYEGLYQVSSLGRVRSNHKGRWRNGRILRGGINSDGYACVILCRPGDRQRNVKVHRLVLWAFLGPPPDGYQVNHKNRIRSDNRLENLEYTTPGGNVKHGFDNGRPPVYGHCVLNREQAEEIRRLYSTGEYSQTKIAKMFDVGQATVSKIILYKRWN